MGAALAAAWAGLELHAADIDPAAVRCARRNLAAAGGQVYEGDLYEPLPAALRGRVDVLVANVPYVPTEEIGLLPPEARLHEPRVALDGGADGLDVLRRVRRRGAALAGTRAGACWWRRASAKSRRHARRSRGAELLGARVKRCGGGLDVAVASSAYGCPPSVSRRRGGRRWAPPSRRTKWAGSGAESAVAWPSRATASRDGEPGCR